MMMGANKFASSLHRSSNRLTLVLVYAFLEWILILLLLLNSLLSYLILRFAEYFGLKTPCLWCASSSSTIAITGDTTFWYGDLICQDHASQIATFTHQKLAQSHNPNCCLGSSDDGQVPSSGCSCCYFQPQEEEDIDAQQGTTSSNRGEKALQDPNVVAASFADLLNAASLAIVVSRAGTESDLLVRHLYSGEPVVVESTDTILTKSDDDDNDDHSFSETLNWPSFLNHVEDDAANKHESDSNHATLNSWGFQPCLVSEIEPLIDDDASSSCCVGGNALAGTAVSEMEESTKLLDRQVTLIKRIQIDENECYSMAYTVEGDLVMDLCRISPSTIPTSQEKSHDDEQVMEGPVYLSPPSHIEELDKTQFKDDPGKVLSLPLSSAEDQLSAKSFDVAQIDDHSLYVADEGVQARNEEYSFEEFMNQHVTVYLGLKQNEEEDGLPDTPPSIDDLDNLHRSWLFLQKRLSTSEESQDNGCIESDFEDNEGGLEVDKLKTALKRQRKALDALYAELEEERNASAVAASQTMAMISRLQEEKAAVQMEALQYQRMMEEQTEYDQEALQLLNELMVKREKEKQQLEKELEIYQNKVIDYETREIIRMRQRRKEETIRYGSPSHFFSNADDSHGTTSVGLNGEIKDLKGFEGNDESESRSTPVSHILNVEDSLRHYFEIEMTSILEHLNVSEEKLFTLTDGFKCNHGYSCSDINGAGNGFHSDVNGGYNQERRNMMASKAKRLLPLFDARVDGHASGELKGNENGLHGASHPHYSSSTVSETENKNHISIETDSREFLRHCFKSLKKGGKGLELLEEILQRLGNLRCADVQDRNMGS